MLSLRIYKLLGKKKLGEAMAKAYANPTVKEYFKYSISKNDLDQLALARKAVNTIDVADELGSLHIPVLVLVGRDFGEHFVKISRDLAARLQDGRIVELGGAKDPSNLVNPEAFDRQVLQFLGAESPAPPILSAWIQCGGMRVPSGA